MFWKKKKNRQNNEIKKDIFEVSDEIIFEEIQNGPQEEPVFIPVEFNDINEEKRENK